MNTLNTHSAALPDDAGLLLQAEAALKAAGDSVKARFSIHARPGGRNDIVDAIALPPGEWWVVDPVEGAINHIHGQPDWCVTATLVRDNQPVLTAVHLPIAGDTYTARLGAGAWLNGVRLAPSAKTELRAAMAGTGQATPDEGSATYRRLGRSVTAMLDAVLVVRAAVPATLQLVQVAAGRQDIFWQYSQVRSGLLAGALLVAESGGNVTDIGGAPWRMGSTDFMASAPALTMAAVAVLAQVAA